MGTSSLWIGEYVVATIRKISVNGEPTLGIEVHFEIKEEPWSEYELVDGGTVRFKNVVHRICLIVDEEGKAIIKPDGDPNYAVFSVPIVSFRE